MKRISSLWAKQQCDLVHSIADSMWRLQRIRFLEQALFAKGRAEFAGMFPEAEPGLRFALIELHTFEVYEKKLRNLSLQEARLCRRRDKEVAELRLLQRENRQNRQNDLKAAAKPGEILNPAGLGFDFSTDEIDVPVHPGSAPEVRANMPINAH